MIFLNQIQILLLQLQQLSHHNYYFNKLIIRNLSNNKLFSNQLYINNNSNNINNHYNNKVKRIKFLKTNNIILKRRNYLLQNIMN